MPSDVEFRPHNMAGSGFRSTWLGVVQLDTSLHIATMLANSSTTSGFRLSIGTGINSTGTTYHTKQCPSGLPKNWPTGVVPS